MCLFLVLFTVQVPTVPEEATIVRTLGKILPSPHRLRHARKQEHNPADIHSLGGGGDLVSSQCFSGRFNIEALIFFNSYRIEENRILY